MPPLAALDGLDLSGQRVEYLLIPCCIDCNRRLGRSLAMTLVRRRRIIRKGLERRYKNILRKVVWDDDELAGLGRNLKSYVEAAENRRQWVLERLRVLKLHGG